MLGNSTLYQHFLDMLIMFITTRGRYNIKVKTSVIFTVTGAGNSVYYNLMMAQDTQQFVRGERREERRRRKEEEEVVVEEEEEKRGNGKRGKGKEAEIGEEKSQRRLVVDTHRTRSSRETKEKRERREKGKKRKEKKRKK